MAIKKEKPGKSGEVELTEEELEQATGGFNEGKHFDSGIGKTSPLGKKAGSNCTQAGRED